MQLVYLFIKKYLFFKHEDNYINYLSRTSIVAIAVSIAIMFTVLSIFDGVSQQIRKLFLSTTAHVQIYLEREHSDAFAKFTEQQNNVYVASKVAKLPAGVVSNGGFHGVMLQGVETSKFNKLYQVEFISGNISNENFTVVIGKGLANRIGARVGDSINICLNNTVNAFGVTLPRIKKHKVTGIYKGNRFLENDFVFSNFDNLHSLNNPKIIKYMLKLKDEFKVDEFIKLASHSFDFTYTDWREQNNEIYSAIKLQSTVAHIFMYALILVSSFIVVSLVLILISNKTQDIAVLRSMGMSNAKIHRIYLSICLQIALSGVILGDLIGYILAYNIPVITDFIEKIVGVKLLTEQIFLFTKVPVSPEPWNLVIINIVTFIIVFVFCYFPTRRAAKLDITKALRYQ
jgi:lipoprotein-releasing system permease protein